MLKYGNMMIKRIERRKFFSTKNNALLNLKEPDKWEYIVKLDEELLHGGAVLSEWTVFLVRDADLAFVSGAYLACIITAMSVVESHLKYEYGNEKKERFVDLINLGILKEELRKELHELRQFRNQWVHVRDPSDDADLLDFPQECTNKLEFMARKAIRVLREVIYMNPWI